MSAAKRLVIDPKAAPSSEAQEILAGETMARAHYDFFAQKMFEYSGISLPFSSKNEALVKNRMTKLMRRRKFNSFAELRRAMENPDRPLIDDFISALTTNKTHFFREDAHFEFLKDYFKNHFKTHSELRIWCAAASTGQEPYTIAMLMREHLTEEQISKSRFLATDIDLQCLAQASKGEYAANELEGLPDYLRMKYFDRFKGEKEELFRVKDSLSTIVRFAPLNLIENEYPFKHKFDIIFCRNVLIYFDPTTTKAVITRIAEHLTKDGYLVLGHSESGTVKTNLLKALSRAIYQRT